MAKQGEEAVKEANTKFSLPKTKVQVKPIVRQGQWLPEGHSGSFMYDHTVLGVQVPIDRLSGRLKDPLTKEEREFFENEIDLGLPAGDLNPHKDGNFWMREKVYIRKSDDIVTDTTVLMVLDLSKPIEYLHYKILLTNTPRDGGIVAPSWETRLSSGTYRIALVHEGQQSKEKVKRADKMKKAYKYLSKIDKSAEEMFDLLTVYFLSTGKSKRPSEDSDKDFYYSEIQDLIDNDLDGMISIIDNADNYSYMLLIHKALKAGAIELKPGNKYETIEGVPMGNNLEQAVQWLKDDRHQKEYLTLQNQVDLNANK